MQAVGALTPELLPSAAALLAEAFFTNPAHVYLCPDPRSRLARLEWLLGGNLRVQPDLANSFCLAVGLVVDAMGFWTDSTSPTAGLRAQIRAGLLSAPIRLGLSGVGRLFEVTRAIDRQVDTALGAQPHWFLNNMVVRKQLRGTGIGTRLLGNQLERVAEAQPDFAIALSTQRPENVVFYQRLGFRAVLDEMIGTGSRAFRSWIMVHRSS